MSNIWHTEDENPDANVGFACYRNLSHVENCTYLQNGGFQPTGSWAYIKDLLALETELERTRKALEQSEICCSKWEKQALDYKAENIDLSIKMEFVIGELKEIDKLLSSNKFDVNECPLLNITQARISMLSRCISIKQRTALEQKDK